LRRGGRRSGMRAVVTDDGPCPAIRWVERMVPLIVA